MSRVPPQPQQPNYPPQDDLMTKLIPRNGFALAAYYVGIFSIIPLLGAFSGPVAVGLGIKGLLVAKARPQAKGQAHAIVGIVCGALFGLFWIAVGVAILIAVLAEPRVTHY